MHPALLDIFFVIHDPTQTDGQGEDIGTQYESAVFYCGEEQKKQAIDKITSLRESGVDVATVVLELGPLYEAEDYHQNYWNTRGPSNPYCSIIPGKIAKMRQHFKEVTVEA